MLACLYGACDTYRIDSGLGPSVANVGVKSHIDWLAGPVASRESKYRFLQARQLSHSMYCFVLLSVLSEGYFRK